MALVLSPVAPLDEWFSELDVQTQRAASFFQGRYVILDLSLLPREDPGIPMLIEEFRSRGVRLIGVEGADPSWETAVWQMPPSVSHLVPEVAPPDPAESAPAQSGSAESVSAKSGPAGSPLPEADLPAAEAAPPLAVAPIATITAEPAPASLLLQRAVRSGQTVTFDKGDVIVVGAVSSGAEIFAGGSIHIYGTLRGRAIAGVAGLGAARIFCRKLDAELLAIGGVYKTAEDIEPSLRGRAVQAWVEGDEMIVAALD
jgi:septum site-determining protein MinC